MDEINTSSCLGLLKEIIIDRTIDGKVCCICIVECIHYNYSGSKSSVRS